MTRLLGQGGMGSVYAVVDRTNGARLALKRLHGNTREKAGSLFEREYRTLAGLRHPNIVEVYDYGTDEEGAYYTMELVEGRDLSTRAPLPWRKACGYLRDTASILGLLHARRLLHRDLSPRNLIETADGQLKLIDFGALADFGPAHDLVGTPPFVAPEALRTAPLDQRSDLFALGALGYWLITGANAYPARQLGDLPQLWQREPIPPSAIVAAARNELLEAPPQELDDLLAALLRVERAERPASTTELIDRLNAVAELEPEASELAVQGYLASKVFVGRERERERFAEALAEARRSQGQVLAVEADPGVGRSRFLDELAVQAQLDGALTLTIDASTARRPYAGAAQLLDQWFQALPELARTTAQPHASVVAHAAPALRAQLGVERLAQIAGNAVEGRVRLQNALLQVFSSLAQTQYTVLLVDDLQAVDEESQALLAAFAHGASSLRVCLVVSLGRDPHREYTPAVNSLRGIATRIRLLPLSASETRTLLSSVFGDVAYLDRMAERLYRVSEGNPAHTLELAQHIVQTGSARYAEGGWVLPNDLDLDSLPRSRQAGLLTRLERLSAPARRLAQQMSVPHGSWTVAHAVAGSGLPEASVRELLAELEREHVLRGEAAGLAAVHEDLGDALYRELDVDERRAVHRRLGDALARDQDESSSPDAMRASAHYAHANDLGRSFAMLRLSLLSYASGDISRISKEAGLLEEVYLLLRDGGADDYALAGPLAMLSVAGYFTDRRYAERYGDLTLATLQRVLRLSVAHALQRFLGKRVALFIALICAAVPLALRRRRAMPLQFNVRVMISAASALVGAAAVCLDGERAARYTRSIELFRALGPDHPASVVYQFSKTMTQQTMDHPARTASAARAMLARLRSDRPIEMLPDNVRASYVAGSLLALGVVESWRDSPEVLAIADELEQLSPISAMVAEHIRAGYFAGQGDLERAAGCRRRLEVHAVQQGSAWQVETWAPADAIKIGLRTHDATVMKRAVQELSRLSASIRSLSTSELNARIGYLVLRGKHQQAIELYESEHGERARGAVGWTRGQGVLARAYNALGKHEQARELCMTALATLEPEDLEYAVMNLGVQLELALAEAGIGRPKLAHAQLDKLFAQHEPNHSPLTLGALHDARARVCLAEREFERARTELHKAQAHLKPLAIASLNERARALARLIDRSENPKGVSLESDGAAFDNVNHLLTRVQLMLSQQMDTELTARASRCLQVALELSSADEGFVVLADSQGEPTAQLGGSGVPEPELVLWAEQSLLDADVDEQTVMTEDVDSQIDSNYKVVGSKRYCVAPLWARQDGQDGVVAALVLGFDNRVPRMPEPAVLRAIASHLIAR
ncbi:MAG TPA: protein kinase [Polyangiales bacterium]|nr:protein kinase [Polyangiales bacterium]